MSDELDKALLRELMANARVPLTEVAKKLNVARTTLSERLEKLEESGIIRGYRLDLDPRKLGYKYTAFVLVKAKRGELKSVKPSQEALAEKIIEDCRSRKGLPWIEEVHIITGEYDLLLKLWAREWDELTNFLIRYMPSHADVNQTHTMLVLKTTYDDPRPYNL